MSEPVVEVDRVSYVYRDRGGREILANDRVSLALHRGEILGLLGPNGAGKTTLVLQILGVLTPTSGRIFIDGRDRAELGITAKASCGFLPQTGLAMRELDVERVLVHTGALRGQTMTAARAQADDLLQELELTGVRDRRIASLSGGVTRMVDFAVALMGRPRLLVLDEPTNHLDPALRRTMWAALTRRNREQGTTCLLVTHNLLEAERVVHRVAVMAHGRIITQGAPSTVRARAGVDAQLEVRVAPATELAPAERDALERAGVVERAGDGVYRVALASAEHVRLAASAVATIGLDRIEDFRIAPASLEDAYHALDLDVDDAPGDAPPPRESSRPPPRPAPPPSRRAEAAHAARSTWLLFVEQLLYIRAAVVPFVVFAVLLPVLMVFGMSRMGSGLRDANSVLYLVAGSAVYGLVAEGIVGLAHRFGAMKNSGALHYYATLPISASSLLLALVASRVLVFFPSVVASIAAGILLCGASLHVSPWLLVLAPLASLSLVSVGMALGTLIKPLDLLPTITNVLMFLLVFAAPVFIPVGALPVPLQVLSTILPPTYAADGFRLALSGASWLELARPMSVLFAFALLNLWIVRRTIRF